MIYTTEREARLHYLTGLLRCCGIAEGSDMHKAILHLYNQIDPLPRGHRAVLSDDWCAIFMCAIAHSQGYRSWPFECSCSRIIQQAEAQGRWHRAGEHIPQLGDWVIYDWGPNGKVDHIGAVAWIEDGDLWIVEGNNGDAVKVRSIASGNAQIYGYVELDFSELVNGSGAFTGALLPGDSGERVYLLQVLLKGAGYYAGVIDGDYGASTTAAVTAFQAANALEPDGKCGPMTQGKLRSGSFALKTPTDKEVENVVQKTYKRVEDVPKYARPTIEKLVENGWLLGVGPDDLGLTDDLIRMLVINDRAGLYGG